MFILMVYIAILHFVDIDYTVFVIIMLLLLAFWQGPYCLPNISIHTVHIVTVHLARPFMIICHPGHSYPQDEVTNTQVLVHSCTTDALRRDTINNRSELKIRQSQTGSPIISMGLRVRTEGHGMIAITEASQQEPHIKLILLM